MIELALFGHQPIVERRSRTTHVQRPRRGRRKAHARWFFAGIFAFEGKDLGQFGDDGHIAHGAGATGLDKCPVAEIAVHIAFALQLLHQLHSRITRSGRSGAAEASGCGGLFASFCGEGATTGRDKGLQNDEHAIEQWKKG